MSLARSRRVVVGARGEDAAARLAARALLMSGREVVFIGGDQSIEQVTRTVVSEDASAVVLDGSAEDLRRLVASLEGAGVGHVATSAVDLPDADAGGCDGIDGRQQRPHTPQDSVDG